MEEQEINIAIMKACGWKHHEVDETGFTCKLCGVTYSRDIWRAWEIPYLWCNIGDNESPPNYYHDLNAMHEAWKTLTEVEHRQWTFHLQKIVQTEHTDYGPCKSVTNATACQRAEAFLRVKGLWKD
jgi:hypothetical protein